MTIRYPVPPTWPAGSSDADEPASYTTRGLPIRRPAPSPHPPASAAQAPACDCNGPCMCAAPVPLLRWFAAQVAVYHGPASGQEHQGQCGQPLRSCGMCMLVASLHRAIHERWQGILP